MKVLFLADQFSDAMRGAGEGYPGGAELTDEAAIRACPWPIECARTEEFDPARLGDYDVHVIGNFQRASSRLIGELVRTGRHILFEHDVRICRRRGNFVASHEYVHRHLQRCVCPHPHVAPLFESALGTIFLTHRQLAVYQTNPFLRLRRPVVLGSSLFTPEFFERVDARRAAPCERDLEAVVVYSKHRIKGFAEAQAYSRSQGVDPFVVRALPPPEVLDVFERARRFIFLPQGPEPAGRLPVEARFLGAEVVTNGLTGVTGESWWHLDDDHALEVLRDAPHRFWRIVEHLHREQTSGRTRAPLAIERIVPPLTYASLVAAERALFAGPVLSRLARARLEELREPRILT